MSQQQPHRPRAGREPIKYGDVFNVSGELASKPIAPRDAAAMQATENMVLGETQKGGPAAVMQSAATHNEQTGLVGHRDATVAKDGVGILKANHDGNRVVIEGIGDQVLAQYMEPPVPAESPGGVHDPDAITIGEALEASGLSAGDKAVDQSDAAAVYAAEMRATGKNEISAGGVAARAQHAATVNTRQVDKTILHNVLEDASQKLPRDKPVTCEDAKAIIGAEIRNSPQMRTTSGGVAESMVAAARLNQNND